MWGKIDIEQLTHRTAGTGGVKFGNKLVVQVNRLYDELVALTGKNVPEPRNHGTLKEIRHRSLSSLLDTTSPISKGQEFLCARKKSDMGEWRKIPSSVSTAKGNVELTPLQTIEVKLEQI